MNVSLALILASLLVHSISCESWTSNTVNGVFDKVWSSLMTDESLGLDPLVLPAQEVVFNLAEGDTSVKYIGHLFNIRCEGLSSLERQSSVKVAKTERKQVSVWVDMKSGPGTVSAGIKITKDDKPFREADIIFKSEKLEMTPKVRVDYEMSKVQVDGIVIRSFDLSSFQVDDESGADSSDLTRVMRDETLALLKSKLQEVAAEKVQKALEIRLQPYINIFTFLASLFPF